MAWLVALDFIGPDIRLGSLCTITVYIPAAQMCLARLACVYRHMAVRVHVPRVMQATAAQSGCCHAG